MTHVDPAMKRSVQPATFSQNLAVTAGLAMVLAITFGFYVRRENDVDRANRTRITSLLLAGELRQSSGDLTRMARSYVNTGDSAYRKYYQTILDIRDGRALRPARYFSIDADLFPASAASKVSRQKPVALLDLMRQAGFTASELGKLTEAKANSDSLTRIELEAMGLASTRGRGAAANQARAVEMLYDERYNREKASIMRPIDDFLLAVDRRTQGAVENAESTASVLRYAFILVGIGVILMIWSTYAALLKMMGGSVNNVYRQIAALGSGDFAATDPVKPKHRNSVLGWLSEARTKLDESRLAGALDATERTRAQEALRQSEQRTRLILDNALDAVITMRPSGAISDWNAQAENMFGWSRAEALGQQMSATIIPPRYREAHDRGLKKFLATGEGPVLNKRIEITALRRDGSEFPVELAISPAKVGEEWTFSAFIRDLTERKKAEEALKLGEERYRGLFENIPVGIFRSNPEGMFIDVNPAMVSMLGYPDRESLLATPASSLYADADDRFLWEAQVRSGVPVINLDTRMLRADGAVIGVSSTTNVRKDASGATLFYEGVLEDVTTRLAAERALQASERRLNQILETAPLGIFVAGPDGAPIFVNAAAENILGKGVVPGASGAQLADVYNAYLAGTDQPYPADRMPLVRALAGERSTAHDMEIRQLRLS